jgi:competence protein ComGC
MKNSGYIGIIVMLIIILIISFLLVRPEVFTGKKETKSTIETSIGAINQAKQLNEMSQPKIPKEFIEIN